MSNRVSKVIEKHYNEILTDYEIILEAMKNKGDNEYVSYIWGYMFGKIEILFQFEEITARQLNKITEIYDDLQLIVPKYLKANA